MIISTPLPSLPWFTFISISTHIFLQVFFPHQEILLLPKYFWRYALLLEGGRLAREIQLFSSLQQAVINNFMTRIGTVGPTPLSTLELVWNVLAQVLCMLAHPLCILRKSYTVVSRRPQLLSLTHFPLPVSEWPLSLGYNFQFSLKTIFLYHFVITYIHLI